MKRWLTSLALVLGLSLNYGCAAQLVSSAIQQGRDLTPEQIKALSEVGSAVYGCFQVGGPPPAGNMIWLIVPKGSTVNIPVFGDNCHIIR